MTYLAISAVRICLEAACIPIAIDGRLHRLLAGTIDRVAPHAGREEIETQYGHLTLDLSCPGQRLLAYGFSGVMRHYEHSPLGMLLMAGPIDERSIFLDVGTNLGAYSMIAYRYGFEVVCFEPDKKLAAYLIRNSHIFRNICAKAISDHVGNAPFYSTPKKFGASSLEQESGMTCNSVQTDTIHSAVAAMEIPIHRIGIVKIDVEGSETDAVAGLIPILDSGCRPTIICEVRGNTGRRGSGSYYKVRDILAKFGYGGGPDIAPATVFDVTFTAAQIFDIGHPRTAGASRSKFV